MSKKIVEERGFFGIVDEFLRIITLGKKVQSYTTDSDLLTLTKAARVSPLCVTSKELTHNAYYNDILKFNLNLFASVYMSAVPMINVIGKVKVAKVLGQLNPDRDLDTFIGLEEEGVYGGLPENYHASLPSSKIRNRLEHMGVDTKYAHTLTDPSKSNFDSLGLEDAFKDLEEDIESKEKNFEHTGTAKGEIEENTAIGKTITVTLRDEETTFDVNVNINLTSIPVESRLISAVLTNESEDNSFGERYHKWRSGRLAFFKEYLLGLDMLENHKKLMSKDDIGFYEESIRRSRNGKIWGALLRAPSLAEASNIYIITKAVKKDIEKKYRGKFSNPKVRNKVFGVTKALIFFIVDEDTETAEIHYRNIAERSVIKLKSIKKASKKDDMLEIMAVLNKSQAPVF